MKIKLPSKNELRQTNCLLSVVETSRTDSWEEVLFDSCIQKMQNGISKRSGSEGSETVVLRLANIGDSDFNVSDLRTIRLTEKEIENYTLKRMML